MNKFINLSIFALFFISFQNQLECCTRVLWSNTELDVVLGRNMDWFEDTKTNLWIFPRGMERVGNPQGNSLNWTSKYGSLIASFFDIGSTDGLNEKGLSMNILWLAESNYGKREESLRGLSVSLWGQFFLDNFTSVAEAIEYIQTVPFQLIPVNFKKENITSSVHLSLADSSGDSAIIEYLNGKPIIYHDRRYTVLTNSPPFREQLANLKQYKPFGGNKELPGSEESPDRFVRAARYLHDLPKPFNKRENIAYLLSVMRNVAAPFGVTDPKNPSLAATRWRIITDLTDRVYYFESTLSPSTIWVNFHEMDFESQTAVKKLDLVHQLDLVGNVTDKFVVANPFTFLIPN